MSNHTKPIQVLRANVDPLGEAYDGATILTIPAGEHISLSIEFYRTSKASVTMTYQQAKAFQAALDDALGKVAYNISYRQQAEFVENLRTLASTDVAEIRRDVANQGGAA